MNVDDVQRIGVVGAGLMGHGIALQFALSGYDVSLNDVSEEKLERAMERLFHRGVIIQQTYGGASKGHNEIVRAK